MVNIESRLAEIKEMVDRGDYFTINRARQYGKTTTLKALRRYLGEDYVVVSLDFQRLSHQDFATESCFVKALVREIKRKPLLKDELPHETTDVLGTFACGKMQGMGLAELFECFGGWCQKSEKPVVLMIDEVDSSTNNQVFLDFLAQIRSAYLERDEIPAFQSVILAGVYDVKNLKRKLRPDDSQKGNSPWNIAADFLVDMSFSAGDIAGMLAEYEADFGTGMDVEEMAGLIYDYTSGYPFLVSRICKLMDERVAGQADYPDKSCVWTKEGFLEAVKILLEESNTLFESLIHKLEDYPELRMVLYHVLFDGKELPYKALNKSIEIAAMLGFIKKAGGNAVIANRIFEILLYDFFLSEELVTDRMYDAAPVEKNQFLTGGRLNMRLVLERFVVHFNDLYKDQDEHFLEEAGRRYFLLYLKPIINGTGNYYIEAETRNRERTDVVVDYRGEQFVIEMKIWRGNAYHTRGEKQLTDYLDYYHLKKGYMVSFCFNQKKEPKVAEILLGDKVLVEAVV